MIDPQNASPPTSAPARAPRTWDFMETLFVALVAYAVYEGTDPLAYSALVAMYDSAPRSSAVLRALENAASLLSSGCWLALGWPGRSWRNLFTGASCSACGQNHFSGR